MTYARKLPQPCLTVNTGTSSTYKTVCKTILIRTDANPSNCGVYDVLHTASGEVNLINGVLVGGSYFYVTDLCSTPFPTTLYSTNPDYNSADLAYSVTANGVWVMMNPFKIELDLFLHGTLHGL